MRQPMGYEKGSKVCRLRKSIYGLKQSARCWNQKLHNVLTILQFEQSAVDPCLYLKIIDGKMMYLMIYVDDLLVGFDDEKEIDKLLEKLQDHLPIVSLGNVKQFLGLEIEENDGNFSICLRGYIEKISKKFGLEDAKISKTPMDTGYLKQEGDIEPFTDQLMYHSIIGALLYIAVNARPDISTSVSILSRRVSNPRKCDWIAAKRVVRYLVGTKDLKLSFGSAEDNCVLLGFSDADWAGDQEDRKSNTGFVFKLNGAAISWVSRKQNCVTLSSMEAEFVALTEATQEVVWLRKVLAEMGEIQTNPTCMFEDNQSCISFVKNGRLNKRSKHIDTKKNYIKDMCDKEIMLRYCPTEDMVADIMTKPLGCVKLHKFVEELGLRK
jgi:hypothetical protein